MRIEIWSDVMCPYCYIGKRRFEEALEQFEHEDEVEIEWKSFQLNPHMKTDPDANINEYLARVKRWSLEEARSMNEQVTKMAEEEGLEYQMDQAVVANSFDAHRLVQFAKSEGKDDEVEEALFQAYFTEGKNIADHDVLVEIAGSVGLDVDNVEKMLQSDDYSQDVKDEVNEGLELGLRGVPFFVIDRSHAVIGAQSSEQLLDILEQARDEASNKTVSGE